MKKLVLYFHTVRYLRPIQVIARIWFRLYHPSIVSNAAPERRRAGASLIAPVQPAIKMLGPQLFSFLNVQRECNLAKDWVPEDMSKLWTYNLHYFDDLVAKSSNDRLAWHLVLLDRWVVENPLGKADGWEPYPCSRRIVNWIKWVMNGNELPTRCHESLAVQVRWLLRKLEYHILGNHLLANAKALIYAGCYFDGAEAYKWLAKGLSILESQLTEQILKDGGHFELSPMYHAVVLEDLLDIVNVLNAFSQKAPSQLFFDIERMRRWLRIMSHPDGDIAFFNDAAFQVAPTAQELDAYAVRLGLPEAEIEHSSFVMLPESGYLRMGVGNLQLFCDCAAVGPDYLPGHAHADSLSFELSIGDQRVFVNSGTSEYGTGIERQRQRSTQAHNTVVVNEENSSEVWGGFRVARRARVTIHKIAQTPQLQIVASHSGYGRLKGNNEHRRFWCLDDKVLSIEDTMSGSFYRCEAWFHLHPDVTVEQLDHHKIALLIRGVVIARLWFESAAAVEVRNSTWHPQFGISIQNTCIAVRFLDKSLLTRMSWTGLR